MIKPVVSIVVAVYNTQNYLRRCLDSLVFQTYQDIEIIVVDDGSTDASLKILNEYAEKFPNILVPITKENGGLSSARKTGAEAANGDWILFVDSDDWIHPCAVELMIRRQKETDAEMVFAPHANVYDTSKSIIPQSNISSVKEDGSVEIEDILKEGNNSFWGKLWKRDFILENAHFYHIWHEDVAEVPALISKLEKVAFVKKPLYFYYQDNNDSITKTKEYSDKRLDLFKAYEWCYQGINLKYEYEYRVRLGKNLCNNIQFNEIYDKSVTYAKEMWEKYSLEEIWEELSECEQKKWEKILELGETVVPEILYLNGFNEELSELYGDDIRRAFFATKEIVLLNKESCMGEFDAFSEKLLREKRYDELGIYFACRRIYENGGIYIAPEVEIVDALDQLKFDRAFFCFEDVQHISTSFFGGAAGSLVFKEILRFWVAMEERGSILNIQEAFEVVLTGFCGVHLNNREHRGIYGEHIYSANWFLYAFATKRGLIKRRAGKDEYIIPLEYFIKHEKERRRIEEEKKKLEMEKKALMQERKQLRAEKKALRIEKKTLCKEKTMLHMKGKELKEEIKKLKRENRYMKESFSWKLTKPLRFLRNLLKRIRI